MIMQYLIDFQFQMLFEKSEQKNILLTEMNVTIIEITTVNHIKK